MADVLSKTFRVRGLDLENRSAMEDFVAGSVADLATLERAFEGVDALVITHMVPNKPGNYDTPELPFDVNVKGTALLLHMAVKKGIKRVVLVSSAGVVGTAFKNGEYLTRDLPSSVTNMYGLTKLMQETLAHYYHQQHGLEVAILRPAYICCGDSLKDKYGVQRPSVNWQFIDPRDIGKAASCALTVDELGYEVFYLMAGPGVHERADVGYTETRLGWQPDFRFEEFPRDEEVAKKV